MLHVKFDVKKNDRKHPHVAILCIPAYKRLINKRDKKN